jgi:hypothetical protein
LSVDIHIYPEGDLKPHNTDSRLCDCRPRLEHYDEGCLVIHNSWDGREIREGAIEHAFEAGRN